MNRMYMNEEDWPVPAPFEYLGNEHVADDLVEADITGRYEIINHGTDNGKTMIKSQMIDFHKDGSISGDITGNWTYDEGFISITVENTTFKGTVLRQEVSTFDKQKIAFSTFGDNNESIWGVKEE